MPKEYIEETIDLLIKIATNKEITDDAFIKIKNIIYELKGIKLC